MTMKKVFVVTDDSSVVVCANLPVAKSVFNRFYNRIKEGFVLYDSDEDVYRFVSYRDVYNNRHRLELKELEIQESLWEG